MKTYKEVERPACPAYMDKVCNGTFCDICEMEIECPKNYDISEVVVSSQKGVADPDGGGWTTTLEYDICPYCFKTKIIPFIGRDPRRRERAQ